jgi:hypothetical protein
VEAAANGRREGVGYEIGWMGARARISNAGSHVRKKTTESYIGLAKIDRILLALPRWPLSGLRACNRHQKPTIGDGLAHYNRAHEQTDRPT